MERPELHLSVKVKKSILINWEPVSTLNENDSNPDYSGATIVFVRLYAIKKHGVQPIHKYISRKLLTKDSRYFQESLLSMRAKRTMNPNYMKTIRKVLLMMILRY
ncbi:hypothetical protein MASR2M39_31350 [Ignavibacteriales bacterium]